MTHLRKPARLGGGVEQKVSVISGSRPVSIVYHTFADLARYDKPIWHTARPKPYTKKKVFFIKLSRGARPPGHPPGSAYVSMISTTGLTLSKEGIGRQTTRWKISRKTDMENVGLNEEDVGAYYTGKDKLEDCCVLVWLLRAYFPPASFFSGVYSWLVMTFNYLIL